MWLDRKDWARTLSSTRPRPSPVLARMPKSSAKPNVSCSRLEVYRRLSSKKKRKKKKTLECLLCQFSPSISLSLSLSDCLLGKRRAAPQHWVIGVRTRARSRAKAKAKAAANTMRMKTMMEVLTFHPAIYPAISIHLASLTSYHTVHSVKLTTRITEFLFCFALVGCSDALLAGWLVGWLF